MKTNTIKTINWSPVLLVLFVFFIGSSGALRAQSTLFKKENTETKTAMKKHAISMCPGGIAFGVYSVNYQQLLSPRHSLVFRGDYEAIPKSYSDANIESDGWGLILNYRYHFTPGLNSMYAGIFGRYRHYKGEGELPTETFDFKIPDCTIGLNVGKRWLWRSGFTMNFALGYGYQYDELKLDNPSPEIERSIDDFKDNYDFFNGFLGEFSIGYAF